MANLDNAVSEEKKTPGASFIQAAPTDPKILLVSDAFKFAGTERHIADLARGLHSMGVKVSLACPEGSILWKESEALGIKLFNWDASNPLADLQLVQGLLSSNAIDIVHTHNGISNMIVTFAASIVGKGKCVNSYHFIEPTRAKRKGMLRFAINAMHGSATNKVSHFIAVSQAVADGCGDFAQGKPISIIHNGIFPKHATAGASSKRAELGIADTDTLLVAAARLAPEKNLEVLLKAMALAKKNRSDLKCLVAGEGPDQKLLADLIADLNISDCVKLLGFRNDVPDLIQASDIFVLPSAAEPFGLVVLEAMVLEKPVLVADAGGPLEIVERDKTGIFFKANDAADLAKQIESVANNKDKLAEMGVKAAAAVREKFDAMQMARKTLDVYRSVHDTRKV